ncbi:MAG: hypothetical protein F2562_08990, partial [Actinobacteria bacterium]|nr:hypothetical protein [Actinomycetota bacterium]
NEGAVGNLRRVIKTVLEKNPPTAPSRARIARTSIGGILRDNPSLSEAAREYLEGLRDELELIATDGKAIEEEDKDLERASKELEKKLDALPGVYVYTLPSFRRAVQKTDPERFWFKIGKTDRVAGVRISEQMRATGLPEDPWLAKVYSHATKSPKELETAFHLLLEAAGHSRAAGRHSGRDWYATNLDFLDAIATALGCDIASSEPLDD